MNLNEAKLATKLGLKVRLPYWQEVKYVTTFHDNGELSYTFSDLKIRKRTIPNAWCNREDWEIYNEPKTTN